ncbi:unnamed protein product, partial [Iphiclides podalirius]
MVGDPYKTGCSLGIGPSQKQLCSSDNECPNNLACVNRTCISPCTSVTCGPNAFCEVENHAAWCRCNPGYTKPEEGKCISGCDNYSCATAAQCIISKNGPTCVCPEGMVGNPFPGGACRQDVCGPGVLHVTNRVVDVFVMHFLSEILICCACHRLPLQIAILAALIMLIAFMVQRILVNVIKDIQETHIQNAYQESKSLVQKLLVGLMPSCGINAVCSVNKHRMFCACEKGYLGNPFDKKIGCFKVECVDDFDCPSDKKCNENNNKCTDKCDDPSCVGGKCVTPFSVAFQYNIVLMTVNVLLGLNVLIIYALGFAKIQESV